LGGKLEDLNYLNFIDINDEIKTLNAIEEQIMHVQKTLNNDNDRNWIKCNY